MTITEYKNGLRVAGIYPQGVPRALSKIARQGDIMADLFDYGDYYVVPNVHSDEPGSGKFLEFLTDLKESVEKPVVFALVTNQRLFKYLEAAGIDYLHRGQIYKPKVENNPLLKRRALN